MRPNLIVVATPVLNEHLDLQAVSQPFHRQALIAKLAVEAFIGDILPGLAGFDQYRFQIFAHRPL